MTGRDAIFATIKKSLQVAGDDRARRETVAVRLEKHPRGIIPARGQKPKAERTELFRQMVEHAKASIVMLDSKDDVPAAVAAYLRSKNLPQSIRHGDDERLSLIPWAKERTLEVTKGASDGAQLASVSYSFAGVAESGTLVMLSGADNPTTLNFLPDHHLVVVDERDIAGDYETIWDRLRERFGANAMPRVVNWITGPSRSGDIEQTHLLGAHGPRSLHVLVVRNS
ncbi:MAG: lactate utilization protein [Xanthobacteraceae bacterium]|nr:lactate utilization protein [Xanthobacteraceae bacterium]MCW5678567.1 lactate utilization protein [Xanthobacteraceae bacterium]